MNSFEKFGLRKCCAAIVAAALAFQPLGAYAAPIVGSTLAEDPLQNLNPVKPNIMYTVDDSASMNVEYTPDRIGELAFAAASLPIYCRDNAATILFLDPTRPFACGDVQLYTPRQYDPPIRSADFNNQYYNPTATYGAGRRADGTDLPYESVNPGTWTSVYVDGFAGYPASNAGGTINLTTGFPDSVWCNVNASSPPSAADIATATAAGSEFGSICRLNGRAYPAYTRFLGASILWQVPAVTAGYNYPNRFSTTTGTTLTTDATTCPVAADPSCVFMTRVTVFGNPYYYTISRIQYCSSMNGGHWGTGTCTSTWDRATTNAVQYGTNPAIPFDPQAFTRVDITPTGFSVNGGSPTATDPSGSGRTASQAMANFAKWYAFDRTRLLAMKTASGRAFSVLTQNNARVGFHTLHENGALFQNVDFFTPSQKDAWFTKVYAVTPPAGAQTPLPDAVSRIGEYFRTGSAAGLPGAADPLDATTGQCQKNYHLLATDGYWNVPLSTGSVGNQDRTVPSLPAPVPGFTVGSPFPRPYLEGPTPTSDTLADLAMKYWITDLRGLPDKVPDTVAPWQHLTLYGVSIGAVGSIAYPNGVAAITAGTKDWPTVTGTGGPEAIDDLWHASLNSRGKFFNASNPQDLANSIVSALNDFVGPSGTGTGVGIAGAQLTATNNFGYLTSFDSTWAGDVQKYAFNAATGAIPVDTAGNPLNPPLWSAQVQLDAQVVGTGWDTNRRIVTINDAGTGVPFRTVNLSTAQQASLVAGWIAAAVTPTPTADAVLNYLRGDKSNEGVTPASFRVRMHALGDIVYSGAVTVGAPREPYDDGGNPGFQSFALAQKTRTPMVYVGANDGMMHAFNDSTGPDAGKETWAYVPRVLFSNGDPNDDTHAPNSAFQIGALSYNAGIPSQHRFYVNATPRIWNIDFANTNRSTPPTSGNDWRTLLVGGLGAGGRAVYALDVTTPVAPPPPVVSSDTEATVASSKVLWEFTETNLGYVFDAPTLVKTRAYGWVVLVTSGYNNPGGKGFLYVLDPKTGTLLQKLPLPGDTGNDANPTGLSTVRAYTPSRRDPYVLQAYSGDLKGNVWRFDLSSSNPADWSARTALIARLTDGSNPQPITTGIRIEIDQNNNVDRYLFIGTGKLLGPSDIADASVTNSLYVIRDGTRTAAEAAPATPYSRLDLNSVSGTGIGGFTGPPTGRGWYQDATDPTQKIGGDVFADVQTVVYTFSKPQTSDPCLGTLTSTLYARDFTTGNSVLQDQGGTLQAFIDVGQGVAGIQLIQSQTGDVRLQATTFTPVPGKGQVFSFGVRLTGGPSNKHRVSWRLLNRN
jgi:type IV pilus assembly protein PilY1